MRVETRPATLWRRLALAAAIIALALPLTACHATSEFLFCLLSAGAVSPECRNEALAPGAPSPPADVVATSTPPGVDIRWSANLEPDVQGYRIYRSERPGGPYAFQTSSPGNSSAALDGERARLQTPVLRGDRIRRGRSRRVRTRPRPRRPAAPLARPEGLARVRIPDEHPARLEPERRARSGGLQRVPVHARGGRVGQAQRRAASRSRSSTSRARDSDELLLPRAGGRHERPAERAGQVGPVKTVEASGVPPTAPTGLTVRRRDRRRLARLGGQPGAGRRRLPRVSGGRGSGPYTRVTAALVRDSCYLADVEFEQWLRVTAVNSGNQEGPPSESVLATPDPAAPTGLRATAGDERGLARMGRERRAGDLAGYDVYARIVPTDRARGS